MTAQRATGKASQPRSAGFTLIEVVVAIGLFGLLTTALVTVAVLGLKTATGLGVRLDNATQGQTGIAAVSKTLRTAVLPDQLVDQVCVGCADTAIVKATGTEVTFYANLNNTGGGPSLVSYQVLADPYKPGTGMLQQTMQPPTAIGGGKYTFCTPGTTGCQVQTRVLTRGLAWPATPAFAYYDFDGGLIGSSALPSDDLARVSSIDITLSVQVAPTQTRYPSSTAIQRVRLPNADINVLVDPSTGGN